VTLEDAQDADGKQKAVRIDTGDYLKDSSGKPQSYFANDLDSVDAELRLKTVIKGTLELMTLNDPDPEARRSAVMKIGMLQNRANLAVLQARIPLETNPRVKSALGEAIAIIQLKDPDPAVEIPAIQKLGDMASIPSRDVLAAVAANNSSTPAEVAAARRALALIQSHVGRVNFFGTLFRGLSYGSISPGRGDWAGDYVWPDGSDQYGHGELIAVGAYTCYVVENIFQSGLTLSPFGIPIHFPGLNLSGWQYQAYFIVAVPLAFLVAALVGIILEVCVIRFLYAAARVAARHLGGIAHSPAVGSTWSLARQTCRWTHRPTCWAISLFTM